MKQANKENGEVHTADGKPTASDCGLEPDSSSGLSLSSYSMQNHTRHYRYLILDMFLSSFIFQPHMTIRWLFPLTACAHMLITLSAMIRLSSIWRIINKNTCRPAAISLKEQRCRIFLFRWIIGDRHASQKSWITTKTGQKMKQIISPVKTSVRTINQCDGRSTITITTFSRKVAMGGREMFLTIQPSNEAAAMQMPRLCIALCSWWNSRVH